jgi:hypothetical protein
MSHDPHSHHDPENSVELPTPTMWPIITAFGITLMFAGIVTDYYVSLVGFILTVAGAIGWFTDVFPHPKHEPVPFVPVEKRVKEVCREGRTVSHLHPGEDGHREHVVVGAVHPYSAGIVGGLLGGIAMAVVASVWGLISTGSIWFAANLLAASGLPELSHAALAGEAGMPTLTSFHFVGLIVALVIHVTTAAMVGLLYTVMLPMLPSKPEWLWGGLITPLIWTACIWASLRYVNPGLNEHINWLAFIVSQVAFGLVCGFYVYRSANVAVQQSWPISARLGVEAQHKNKE